MSTNLPIITHRVESAATVLETRTRLAIAESRRNAHIHIARNMITRTTR